MTLCAECRHRYWDHEADGRCYMDGCPCPEFEYPAVYLPGFEPAATPSLT